MLLLFFLSMIFVFMVGCAGKGNYGRLVPNDKVKSTFETYQLPPDFMYYYSGPDAYPNALIGIRDEYRLESKFWKPVDLTKTQLKKWLEMGGRPRPGYNLDRNGSDIIGPEGSQVGIWYAVKNWKDRATIKMIDDKTVNISPPLEDPFGKKRREIRN